MRDAGIGRVLVASLHQGIADTLPQRLSFYESWLHAEGLRDGTIGLAPLYAVLSFLRQEGDAIRDHHDERPASTPRSGPWSRWAPFEAPCSSSRRRRGCGRVSCCDSPERLVRDSYKSGRLTFRLRKGVADARASGIVVLQRPRAVSDAHCAASMSPPSIGSASCSISPSHIDVMSCRGDRRARLRDDGDHHPRHVNLAIWASGYLVI